MGIRYLYWLCFAFLSFSSLAFSMVPHGQNLGSKAFEVNPRTVSTPPNIVSVHPKDDFFRLITKGANSSLEQSAEARLRIQSMRDSSLASKVDTTMKGRFSVSRASLGTGVKSVLRVTPVVAQGALGIQGLLDIMGWYLDDHGELLKPVGGGDPTDPSYWGSAPEGVTYNSRNITGTTSMMEALQDTISVGIGDTAKAGVLVGAVNQSPNCLEELKNQCSIKPLAIDSEGRPISGGYYGNVTVVNPTNSINCSSGSYDPAHYGCVGESQDDFEPVTEDDIDDAVDSQYEPDPTDWDDVFPYIKPDTFFVEQVDPVSLDPIVSTSTDNLTGDVVVTEEQTDFDFSVSDNPSSNPKLDSKVTTSSKTYKNGSLTGSSTQQDNLPARPSESIPPNESSWPSFCDWVPDYVCSFFSWAQEPFDEPEPDLRQILDDRDFTETYTISGGSKQCPPDYEFTIDFVGRTYGLSFEPACDFASKIYYFVMAAAYIFAAYITVGTARNA